MDKERFEQLVSRAIESLPAEFLTRLENVDIVVEDMPTQRQQGKVAHGYTLLGLYEGIPLTRRNASYGMVLPDKITIFQKPIEAKCHSDSEIIDEIQRVVRHEIAHHFGIDDARLEEIEEGKTPGNKPSP